MTTIELTEWSEQSFPIELELENGIRNYLEQVWENRPLLYSQDEEMDDEPGAPVQRFLDFKPGFIKARNYVGFIQYADCRIVIEPKVFEERSLSAESKMQHLLKWLSYSRRIHFPFLESSFDHITKHHDWLEAFIFLFANYTYDVLSTSPHMAYQEVTEETGYVKGRLAMNEYIHQNLVKARHHKVYCTYEPFLYDNVFNRIVKHTCNYLVQITHESTNKYLLEQIIFLLDEVESVYCIAADCDRVNINRMYPEIERINNLCRLFLANQSYSNSDSATNNICVLLPMEVIFEEFVFGFIEKHFPGMNARRQAKDMFLAQTGAGFTKSVFQMKHDILIPGKQIIDTKYKHRPKENDYKGGVNQNDLYQMVAYACRRNIHDVLLLYPLTANSCADTVSYKVPYGKAETESIMIKAASIDIVQTDDMPFENLFQQIKLLLQP